MSKLNLSLFVNALSELPSAEGLPDEHIGESYLRERVIFPLLNGENVSIDDLDMDAFDQTCIDALIERGEQADGGCSALGLYQQAVNTRPAVQADCDFV